MALIKCPECNTKISSKAKTCPQCGCPVQLCSWEEENQELENRLNEKSKCLVIIFAGLIGIALPGFLIPQEGPFEWSVKIILLGAMLWTFWKGGSIMYRNRD